MILRISNFISIGIILLITSVASAQTTEKVNGIEYPSKINSIEAESINSIYGVTIEAYCKNCQEILEKFPGSLDGIYTIDPDGSGAIEPFECYCDMTTDGGGWTMVGYYKNPATTNAPADLDNRDYAYFMKARNNQAYGRPEYIANPDSEGAWTDWRILSGVTWPVEFAVILDQPSWSTGWADHTAKTIYRVKNRNIMPNYGTEQDLKTGDNLYYKWSLASGWTDVGSSSTSDYWFWYPYTSGSQYLTLFNVSNYAYKDDEPTNYHYGVYYGNGIPGGNSTWYHSARMLVR